MYKIGVASVLYTTLIPTLKGLPYPEYQSRALGNIMNRNKKGCNCRL